MKYAIKKNIFISLITFSVLLSLTGAEEVPLDEQVSLDFNNVDIKLVIRLIGELTGTNFAFDNDEIKGTVTIISPTKISVNEALTVLESILEVKGFAMVKAGDLVKIMPRAKATRKNVVTRVGKEVETITDGDSISTQVIPLEYADAQEVYRLISPLISPDSSITASPQSNIVIITDVTSNIQRLINIIKEIDVETPVGKKRIYVYYLQNAEPGQLAKMLTEIYKELESRARERRIRLTPEQRAKLGLFEEVPTIVADESTNALIIASSPRDYELLRELIDKLDIIREQVLLESVIVEVTFDKLLKLGVEWATWDQPLEGSERVFGGTDFAIRSDVLSGLFSGMSLGVIRGADVGLIIEASQKDSDINILSNPHLLTLDNQEAEILIGENIPFLKQARVTETSDGTTPTVIRDFDYRDVGISLKITPHINQEGFVSLEIHELIETQLESPFPETPKTAKREVKNTVRVKDGNTVVIGGMIRDDKNMVIQKVPVLGSMPILGWLFRRQKEITQKTSLLIFITPHVISDEAQMEEITKKKQQEGEKFIEEEIKPQQEREVH